MTRSDRTADEWGPARDAAGRLAAAERPDPADQRALVVALWPLLDRVATTFLRRNPPRDPALDDSALINAFLDRKLRSVAFLRELATASSIPGLVRQTLKNLLLDLLHSSPPVVAASRLSATDAPAGDDTPYYDVPARDGVLPGQDAVGAEELMIGGEGRRRDARRLDRLLLGLDPDERVLLKVVYACHEGLDEEEITWLAARRGIPVASVERELQERVEHYDQRDRRRAECVESATILVLSRHRRLAAVERVMAERGDESAGFRSGAAESGGESPGPIPATVTGLRNASPQERRSWRRRLERLLADGHRRRDELLGESGAGLRGEEGWEEVAGILGELPAGADAATRKRVINRVTRRFLRLVERLQGSAGSERDDD